MVLATAVLAAVAGTVDAQEGELVYSGSLGYLSGDYTLSETTTTVLLINGLTYSRGGWTVSASVPVIHQDTPFVVYSGGAPVPSGRRHAGDPEGTGMMTMGGSGSGQSSGSGSGPGSRPGGEVVVPDPETLDFDETGVGDPLVRVDYAVSEGRESGLGFGVYGAVKPPLADEDSGFGTGELDYGGGVTFSKRADSILFLADLGYWVFGDLPDLELKDPFTYSLGAGSLLADGRYSVLGSISGYSEIVDGVDGPVEAALTLGRRLRSDRSFDIRLSAGLTDTAADFGVSLGWRVGL